MKDYINMTLNQLLDERDALYGAIQNEKLWAFGAQDEQEANMYMDNVEDLRAELRHVIMLISQKRERGNANENLA